jgi:hypothetical protein
MPPTRTAVVVVEIYQAGAIADEALGELQRKFNVNPTPIYGVHTFRVHYVGEPTPHQIANEIVDHIDPRQLNIRVRQP